MSRFDDPFSAERANLLDASARQAKVNPHILGIAEDLAGLDPVAPVLGEAAQEVGAYVQRAYGLPPSIGRAVLEGAQRHLRRINSGEA